MVSGFSAIDGFCVGKDIAFVSFYVGSYINKAITTLHRYMHIGWLPSKAIGERSPFRNISFLPVSGL
jgi:hypothetical protein